MATQARAEPRRSEGIPVRTSSGAEGERGVEWSRFFLPGMRVMALPSWQQPRILIGADTADQRWRASAMFPATRLHARVWRWALRACAWMGVCPTRVAQGATSEWFKVVQSAFPRAVPSAILIGNPGRAQKSTIQFTDEKGRPLAYLKHASSATAQHLLTSEREALRLIGSDLAPKCFAFGTVGGGTGLLTAAIQGERIDASLGNLGELKQYLDQMPIQGEQPIETHPWVTRLRDSTRTWVEPELGSALAPLADRSWPAVLAHGDFAPWNLLRESSGRLIAIDWEYASPLGLPYVDLAYYVLQIGALVKRWSPARTSQVATAAMVETVHSLSWEQARALVRLAALDALLKGRIDGWPDASWLQRWRSHVWHAGSCGVAT